MINNTSKRCAIYCASSQQAVVSPKVGIVLDFVDHQTRRDLNIRHYHDTNMPPTLVRPPTESPTRCYPYATHIVPTQNN
ncbi:uncharacterized protein EAF01_005532 [Botrytis porri]|uniref:uncharacterized protein n=1 Tax=Botrytis porri TaxID=87229 RepID=UPI0018FF1CE4|nr:uncharacterized protein EAF01_005532 [Botrytis porri]KAF7905010.1 hypothetical protein EAF01_005532 [Botrytis porri]